MSGIRSLAWLLAYVSLVFLGGALLAPWLWRGAHQMAAYGVWPWLAEQPFHRFLNRSFLILAVAGLWPFLRATGLNTWQGVGLERRAGWWKQLGLGFVIGFLSLGLMLAAAWCVGARHFHVSSSALALWKHLLNAAVAALAVGIMEELVFRGTVYGLLRRALPWSLALVTASVFFGLVHFLNSPHSPKVVAWNSGLAMLETMVRHWTNLSALMPDLANLVLVGIILALAYQRSGALYFSIGLHAGWVFWMKAAGLVWVLAPKTDVKVWGTAKLVDGWAATVPLALVLFWIWRRRWTKSTPDTGKPKPRPTPKAKSQ